MPLQKPAAAVGFLLAAVVARSDEPGIRLRLVNASRHVIREAYVSRSDVASWGPNLLAGEAGRAAPPPALKPGQRFSLGVSGECGRFDIRLVADAGTELLEDDVELCSGDGVLTVTNGALALTRASQP